MNATKLQTIQPHESSTVDSTSQSNHQSETEATTMSHHSADDLTKPIDPQQLLSRCMGNSDFAISLVDELESTLTTRVNEIKSSVEREAFAETAEFAHTLKGAAGILYATSLERLATEIESSAMSSDHQSTEEKIGELNSEMKRCLEFLPRLRLELVENSNR